ncbi:urease accessory protein UreF [Jiella sp. M17.18]|uniref:urease accessory protein UreF n=1 Tax=Jiella sp. M17.18 TaxID=3234247 RepID=UPI0034DEBE0A
MNLASANGSPASPEEPSAAASRTAGPHLPALLTLFSSAFPIGGFAYSHGLEAAVREGTLRDATGVEAWARLLLSAGSGWNDLVLLAGAWRATKADDTDRLGAAAELATALCGSAERRMETLALGAAFTEASQPWLDRAARGADHARAAASAADEGSVAEAASPAGRSGPPGSLAPPMPYPVAAAGLAAHAGLPLGETLTAYAHVFAASLVSAAVRLVPLAQSEAVGVLHRLEPDIRRAAERSLVSTLDDLGSAALGSEIAAMRHESLQTRLFRS